MNLSTLLQVQIMIQKHGEEFETTCPNHPEEPATFGWDTCVLHYLCTTCFPAASADYNHHLAGAITPEILMMLDDKTAHANVTEALKDYREKFPLLVQRYGPHPVGHDDFIDRQIVKAQAAYDQALAFKTDEEK